MSVRHIPRQYGGGYGRDGIRPRLAIPRPWTGPHPLSMRAATARRQEALAEQKIAELRAALDAPPTTRRTGKTAHAEATQAEREEHADA